MRKLHHDMGMDKATQSIDAANRPETRDNGTKIIDYVMVL